MRTVRSLWSAICKKRFRNPTYIDLTRVNRVNTNWGKSPALYNGVHVLVLFNHMRRFPEPQHFFAAKWQNWDFAIAIIFYPVIRTLWKFLCILFGCCSTQILNFNAKIFFSKMLKIVRKSPKIGSNPDFRTIFNIFEFFFCIEIQNLSATTAK